MSKHTPGPWFVSQNDPLMFGTRPSAGNGLFPIGFVYGPSFAECSEYGQRAIADARLVAAAPDLLEALQDLFGADMEHVLMGDGKDDQIEAIAKGRAAVAKATGASS